MCCLYFCFHLNFQLLVWNQQSGNFKIVFFFYTYSLIYNPTFFFYTMYKTIAKISWIFLCVLKIYWQLYIIKNLSFIFSKIETLKGLNYMTNKKKAYKVHIGKKDSWNYTKMIDCILIYEVFVFFIVNNTNTWVSLIQVHIHFNFNRNSAKKFNSDSAYLSTHIWRHSWLNCHYLKILISRHFFGWKVPF